MTAKGCRADCCRYPRNDESRNSLPGITPNVPYVSIAPLFAGATREYGPDEGWIQVNYKKKGRKARRWLGAANDTSSP